jgi:hypothetical protein
LNIFPPGCAKFPLGNGNDPLFGAYCHAELDFNFDGIRGGWDAISVYNFVN